MKIPSCFFYNKKKKSRQFSVSYYEFFLQLYESKLLLTEVGWLGDLLTPFFLLRDKLHRKQMDGD